MIRRMRTGTLFAIAAAALAAPRPAHAQRVREFVTVKNARENFLEAKGLVIGLNGTGDSPKGATYEFYSNYMENRGRYRIPLQDFNSKNVALVSVTAVLPPFAKQGMRIHARVAALGDAKSLKGGRLLFTPLNGPRADDPRIYAMAEGDLVQGGDSPHPTTAWLPEGAIVERAGELVHEWIEAGERVTLIVRRPDFQVARMIADRLVREPESSFGFHDADAAREYGFVQVLDPATLVLRIPPRFLAEKDPVNFVARVLETDLGEALKLTNDAIVSIDENTGMYAVTGDVWVMPGSVGTRHFLSLEIREAVRLQEWLRVVAPQASVPAAARGGGAAAPAAPQSKDIGELILALDRANMIRGKVVVLK